MRACTLLKPHARRRLWEHHGVMLTPHDFARIGQRLALPTYRDDPRLYRFVQDSRNGASIWQVNLEPYHDKAMWVTVVWLKAERRVKTVLAVPPDVTAEQAVKYLDKSNDQSAQGFGRRGPNQLPRDRKERRKRA